MSRRPAKVQTANGQVGCTQRSGPGAEGIAPHAQDARAEGQTPACGGEPNAELGGLFVRPTVVVASPGTTIVREEVFGPVLAAYSFRDENEAIALANDTPYGLAGAVGTKDIHRAHRVAGKIRAGPCGSMRTGWSRRTCPSVATNRPASPGERH